MNDNLWNKTQDLIELEEAIASGIGVSNGRKNLSWCLVTKIVLRYQAAPSLVCHGF